MARFDTDWNAARSRRSSRRAFLRVLVIVCIVYVVILGALYAIFRTSLFRVQAVNINGTSYTDPDTVRNALMSQRPGIIGRMAGFRSVLAWPTHLSSSTRALIPSVQAVNIHTSYLRRTITVDVVERQPLGIWCFSRTEPAVCLWFDTAGVAYSPAFYTEGSLIPIVHDTAQDGPAEGRRVLPPDVLPNFLAVLTLVKDEHIPMRRADISDIGKQEVAVPTYSGPMFYFSLRFPPSDVAAVLADFRHKETYNGLQYIDFRSENRAFYQ